MRILVWQWGRRGAGPRFAVTLADYIRDVPGVEAVLSLSSRAEILSGNNPPRCDLPVPTYDGPVGFAARMASSPFAAVRLARRIGALRPDLAICAMPGLLDLTAAAALQRLRVPFAVIVHDADAHPGDGLPMQMSLQKLLIGRAGALIALSAHVADRLRAQNSKADRPILRLPHPPFVFGPIPPPPRAHGGRLRLLVFGRLLPYKGLDLLSTALLIVGPRADLEVRVVGSGPESEVLDELRALPGVTVENRWVPEDEIFSLLSWADALVLSHREASQSGVAAVAIAARRWVVATRVGGLGEQLSGEPLAVMCEPDPLSLAKAIRRVLNNPPENRPAGRAADPAADPAADSWSGAIESLVYDLDRTLLKGQSLGRTPVPA